MATLSFDAQWLTLANRALLRVGSKPVLSLDDGSTQANYCNQLLPQAIDSVYSVHPWRDSLKRVQLAPLASAPAYGFAYKFALPTDFARLKSVDVEGEWSLEGQVILTDSESVSIVYSAQPTTPDLAGTVLRDLLVKQLAYLLSIPLTKNDTISGRLLSEFNQALSLAINQDNYIHHEEDTRVAWYDESR